MSHLLIDDGHVLIVSQRLMTSFVNKLFTKKSFEASHLLADNVDDMKDKRILMPDGTRYVDSTCTAVFLSAVFM